MSDDEITMTHSATGSGKRATRSAEDMSNISLGRLLFNDSESEVMTSRAKRPRSDISGRDRRSESLSDSKKKNKKQKHITTPVEARSGRTKLRKVYMETADNSDDYRSASTSPPLKQKSKNSGSFRKDREVFQSNYDSDWEDRHWEICETCRMEDRRQLIYCQACAVGVHQACLGNRSERKHLITKIDEDDYVLQCRHCIGHSSQKGGNRSYITGKVGPLCEPFVPSRSKVEDSTGQNVAVAAEQNSHPEDQLLLEKEQQALREKLYKPESVMFRCTNCLRPAMFDELVEPEDELEYDPARCSDCNSHMGLTVHLVLGWRKLVDDKLDTMEVQKKDLPRDFLREYLVKWTDQPYTRVEWITASWLHGIAPSKKKNFDAKDMKAIEKESDVIPEDYNRVDVVLDVTYTDSRSFDDMDFIDEDEAISAIPLVEQFLAKWQQVQYDDVTWDSPPADDSQSDMIKERREAFVTSYCDWVRGFFVMVEKNHATKALRLSDVPFTAMEKKVQPEELIGGELMPYQMEGLNWLYYQYYSKHPAILADEMGLGKTIQIIAFLSVLHTDWAVAPFLIVAPNSTISNWKREFQKWAPQLRVAAYYGEKSARSMVEKYEMIHKDTPGQPLKVHALITSYKTIETDAALLKRYNWACLIVDEGQRLKNDESILFKILSEFKANHRVLLTGTPLQNNTKELFNLLQFLDPKKMNASKLESYFDIEKQESLAELHSMLQPYFLRRTKYQVLKFLPAKNEVIVPVTMSSLQRELYKTILSKNAELMRLVVSRSSAGKPIQNYNNTSLGNVLQQIRKILSHPFIYSPDIEEDLDDEKQSLENLTNACAKLQLLKVLLPELQARGHRVLIFCQFLMMLDILEDWLNASNISHCRIDGSTPSPERQEAIDQFNAPGSRITCFLLSTRAGGVGINLATADTVIIYDADFNPHQDLQAVARAHRIGQKKKVVVFTLVTRNTAEEKILQIGRQKMVLDQLIIENMATKAENVPYQEILSFGAAALFDEEAKNEVVYDTTTVNNLIESSYASVPAELVDSEAGVKPKAQDSFGFAKVWAVDGLRDEALGENEADQKASEDFWAKILAQRAIEAKAEAQKKSAEFAKGRRRTLKDYNEAKANKSLTAASRTANDNGSASGIDPNIPAEFEDPEDDDDDSDAHITESSGYTDLSDTATITKEVDASAAGILETQTQQVPTVSTTRISTGKNPLPSHAQVAVPICRMCNFKHVGGQCHLRNIPIEICTLCSTAHFSGAQQCPVFSNVDQMKSVLEDLKKSREPPTLVEQAKAYLRGLIGHLTRMEKTSQVSMGQNGLDKSTSAPK